MIKIVIPWGKILIIALITYKLQPHIYEVNSGFGKFPYFMCTSNAGSGKHTCILGLGNFNILCALTVNALASIRVSCVWKMSVLYVHKQRMLAFPGFGKCPYI